MQKFFASFFQKRRSFFPASPPAHTFGAEAGSLHGGLSCAGNKVYRKTV
jgi:hypothetical protein